MNKELERLFEECRKKWGLNAQIMMLAEESAELSVATLHLLRASRDKIKVFDQFAEEIADVQLMIDEMKYYFPSLIQDVEAHRLRKLMLLKERVKQYDNKHSGDPDCTYRKMVF